MFEKIKGLFTRGTTEAEVLTEEEAQPPDHYCVDSIEKVSPELRAQLYGDWVNQVDLNSFFDGITEDSIFVKYGGLIAGFISLVTMIIVISKG